MTTLSENRHEARLFLGVFFAALIAHACFTFYNLKMPFLPGHEFRQSQTALITRYIDRQNNFSPIYEQPLLGKPWVGLILEFPAYQWGVVGLSRATGWPHFLSARVISITAFYLSLPALALLLGRMGLSWPRRGFVLALVLMCPVYIFYTRAFLIDATEFMFCAWFTAAFVETMNTRRWPWLLLAMAAGTAAALIKGFMLMIWLMPAGAYGAWLLWRDWRSGAAWTVPLRTLGWGIATVALPFAALEWWIKVTDPIKEAHPSAWIFTSKNLSLGNWGFLQFSKVFSVQLWQTLFERWSEAIMPPWLIFAGLLAGMAALPTVRWRLLAVTGVFFLSQVLFPFAYAYQDYYYYSCAIFVVAGFGLALLALWDSRAPRWLAVAVMCVPVGAMVKTYWDHYRPQQAVVAEGWTTFTMAINDLTPPNSVIVVAGWDWAAMMPYYSDRRALMIRNGLEFDRKYLERAFADLANEDVSVLVVGGKVRENRAFIDYALERLDMERVPMFSQENYGEVYMPRRYAVGAYVRLTNSRERYGRETHLPDRPAGERRPIELSEVQGRNSFPMIMPAPFRSDLEFGLLPGDYNGDSVLSAHTDSFVWVKPPPGAREILWEFGFFDAAWSKEGDKTNGIEFVVTAEIPDHPPREIFRRLLEPANNPKDRGLQSERIAYTPQAGETLRFAALANGSKAYDWGFWRRIEVK